MYTIRKAVRSDAGPLSLLAERTFRGAFSVVNSTQNMDMHCRGAYSEDFQAMEIANPDRVTLLAEHDEELVGFAQLRWSKAPDCIPGNSPGEIQRMYVANDWHGKGVAQRLMGKSIEEIKARGSDVVWLGVWERNARAIAFYKKLGFVEHGDHVFLLGHERQRDIVMAHSLSASIEDLAH